MTSVDVLNLLSILFTQNLLQKLKQIEAQMNCFHQWRAKIETRMDAYDQLFRHQGAEQKEMQQNEQLRKENQHTLDLADVDLHEKDSREGEADEERQHPLPVDGHRVKQSKSN